MADLTRIPINSLYRVAFCDPSKGKVHRDATQSRSAVVVVGQDDFERLYVLHVFAEQCPTSTFIEQIIRAWREWRPRAVGVDVTGPQQPFYDMLQQETRRRGMRIPFVPVNFHGEKTVRIEDTLEPMMSDGRLFVHPLAEHLHVEGREFPTGYLDGLDCVAACARMLPKKATTKSKITEREGQIEVLKRQGMPFGQILEKLGLRYGERG